MDSKEYYKPLLCSGDIKTMALTVVPLRVNWLSLIFIFVKSLTLFILWQMYDSAKSKEAEADKQDYIQDRREGNRNDIERDNLD